ncbi:MAG: hypothetical protein A2666_00895 [Parcubacteria group bacterium RIFCSPHIGHO2_01_FULL_47_10b]|nr:MAG: hypothetical protein A2666_00895 [Parcubacteria group bacterium RIFCSPHIGHO2_01_FULL_47_10b]
MQITVCGAGGFGTAVAHVLSKRRDHRVTLFGRDPKIIGTIREKRENRKYLPGLTLSSHFRATTDPEEALTSADIALLAIPSDDMGRFLLNNRSLFTDEHIVISLAKGLEQQTSSRPTQVICEVLKRAPENDRVGVLAGPSFATDLVKGSATLLTIAMPSIKRARELQRILFVNGCLRPNAWNDVVGVEICSALKNIYALGSGIVQGSGAGPSTWASYLGAVGKEMPYLVGEFGGKRETFFRCYAGFADLILTCTSDQSRNKRFGFEIGQGRTVEQAKHRIQSTVEGLHTLQSVHGFVKLYGLHAPIISEIHSVVYKDKSVTQAVQDLMELPLAIE